MDETNQQCQELIFTKQNQIKEFQVNDVISDIFIVKSKSSVQDYANATKFRFTLTLADKSSEIEAKYWGSEDKTDVENLWQSLKSGDVVHVTARVQEYHDNLELNVNEGGITKLQDGQYPANLFLEESQKDLEAIYSTILNRISEMQNLQLKILCNGFYQDSKFKEAIKRSPATKMRHHAIVGGLLEHINNLLSVADSITNNYPELNKDLLTSIILLAQVGKTKHLTLSSTIDFTNEGQMLGDILLSCEMVQEKIKDQILDEKLKLKLLNAIISQQGKISWGSPKRPATPEALVYSKIKELDSSLDQMLTQIKEADSDSNFFYSKEFGNLLLD